MSKSFSCLVSLRRGAMASTLVLSSLGFAACGPAEPSLARSPLDGGPAAENEGAAAPSIKFERAASSQLRRGSFDWKAYADLPRSLWAGQIMIKLSDESRSRLDGSRIVDPGGHTLVDLSAVMPEGSVQRAAQGFGVKLETLAALRSAGEERSGLSLPDLSQWYRIHLDAGAVADLRALVENLNAEPNVEIAYPVADARLLRRPDDIAPATPAYAASQGYRDAAPDGIDIEYAAAFAGGDGAGVVVTDLEANWYDDHEDLEACLGGLVTGIGSLYEDEPAAFQYHGTAVLGELFASDNDYGMTGLVPGATCRFAPDYTLEHGTDMSRGIAVTIDTVAQPGDVLLLEAHIPGPNFDPSTYAGLVPVEWQPDVFDTILSATAAGYHIVEAAGNGYEDLDDPVYEERFDRSVADSGAILVGAGQPPSLPPARGPEWFTNWGTRLDVQGWGSAVYTTGYGDLFDGGGDYRQHYTAEFGGTSSASPIVAGAVAALMGIVRVGGGEMSPLAVRDLLTETGTPQAPDVKTIGPLPNLRAAIDALAECGNNTTESSEACDDGNEVGGDGCSADCRSDESCGNGTTDSVTGEICDDGNTAAGDGCSADCASDETCGNGVADVSIGEECDDGNTSDGDGCRADCSSEDICGNSVVDTDVGEQCDDGNVSGGDGCSADCSSNETCGNGVVDDSEECDGESVDGEDCAADCTLDCDDCEDDEETLVCACTTPGSSPRSGAAWLLGGLALALAAARRRLNRP
jgi:serine protease